MAKNITDLSRQYSDLTALADKLQNREQLNSGTMQILASLLARISMLELQLYGEANIYSRSRRNESTDAPF